MREILEIAGFDLEERIAVGRRGLDVENSTHLKVLDGGPYLHDVLSADCSRAGGAYVRRMTNSLFVIPRTAGQGVRRHKTDPPEEGIVSLVGKVSGVQRTSRVAVCWRRPRRSSPRETKWSTSRR